jgi:NAD(P)-dependent dehydrogenase (short-subunit alcohol dehydrogenase family)
VPKRRPTTDIRRGTRAFAAEGARVAITYHSRKDAAETVAEEITAAGGEPFVVPLDLDDPESIATAVEATANRWGGLDALVGNAVQWGSADFHDRPTTPGPSTVALRRPWRSAKELT